MKVKNNEIKMSKAEWEEIGEHTGWLKTAETVSNPAVQQGIDIVQSKFNNISDSLLKLRDDCEGLAKNIKIMQIEPGSSDEQAMLSLSKKATAINDLLLRFTEF